MQLPKKNAVVSPEMLNFSEKIMYLLVLYNNKKSIFAKKKKNGGSPTIVKKIQKMETANVTLT